MEFADTIPIIHQARLYAAIQPGLERFRALPTEDRDEFKKQLGQWVRLYAFLSQLLPFPDLDLEKFYAYARLLHVRLPGAALDERLTLDGDVKLHYYRLEEHGEAPIALEPCMEYGLKGQVETGLKRGEEVFERLSSIIELVNERFGTDFKESDQLFLDSISSELVSDTQMQEYAQANSLENFSLAFETLFWDVFVDRMEQNQALFDRMATEQEFGDVLRKWFLQQVYTRIRKQQR